MKLKLNQFLIFAAVSFAANFSFSAIQPQEKKVNIKVLLYNVNNQTNQKLFFQLPATYSIIKNDISRQVEQHPDKFSIVQGKNKINTGILNLILSPGERSNSTYRIQLANNTILLNLILRFSLREESKNNQKWLILKADATFWDLPTNVKDIGGEFKVDKDATIEINLDLKGNAQTPLKDSEVSIIAH